jgi:GT2 family glycosyltransferase
VITAVVPTRSAVDRLRRYLPSVQASLRASGDTWEVIVVDDGAALRSIPEGVRLVSVPEPRGYGPAVNQGAAAAAGDLLLVLNDDVRLEEPTVRVLREALLARADAFAVAPAIRSPLARCGDEGGKSAVVRAGLIEIEEAPSAQAHVTFYPVGCCYLCPRQTFQDLGGYDDVYAPFFWEDVDLGYRAWRRGLSSWHVPAAVCHHEGSATIGQRPMAERLAAWHRSAALFHLRNVQDRKLRAANFGAWAAHALLDGRPAMAEGLAQALRRFAAAGRREAGGFSDAEILARTGPR